MVYRYRLLIVALAIAVLAGCFEPGQMSPERIRRGMIVLLPGVEGTKISMTGIVSGLRDAGEGRAIDVIPWGEAPFGTFRNLCNLPRNKQRAKIIAERIVAYQKDYPQRPVTLIGYSGGGGIAVLVAEALPKGVILNRIILIAPALSQHYDLTEAVSHSKRSLVHFYSPTDWFQLGFGTSTFGTIDRAYEESAGRRGFKNAEDQLLKSDRIEQIPWREEWWRLGHDGGHLGWLSRRWVRDVLAERIDSSFNKRQNDYSHELPMKR